MSLLQRQALFFCNLETLAQSDPFEGTLPPSHYDFRNSMPMADTPEQFKDFMRAVLSSHGEGDLEPEEAEKQFKNYNEYWARYVLRLGDYISSIAGTSMNMRAPQCGTFIHDVKKE